MSDEPMTASGAISTLRVSVPANLLLLGEYAVLEEGGLGLALAPDHRTSAVYRPSESDDGCTVSGRLRYETVSWPGSTGMLGRLAESMLHAFGAFRGSIEIDTGALYDDEGRKLGYGSSAALTVALAALWPVAAGLEPLQDERLVQRAIQTHRAAQDGHGSGYDIATSALGGWVLFTGGERPRAERVELPWLPPMGVFSGPGPVTTAAAVAVYRQWRDHSPSQVERFLDRSNDLVRRFVSAGSWDDARPIVGECRELGMWLGEAIGVPAALRPPAGAETYKAVGAGNELGVVLPAEPGSAVTIATEGVRWE